MSGNRIRVVGVAAVLTAVGAGSLAAAVAPGAAAADIDPRCRQGRVVCIDKTTHTLRWMVDGQLRLFMSARFGGSHRTREGTFTIYWKDPDHVSNLTGEAMPWSMFFSGGEAIHYSPDFAENGYDGASSGCVDTRDYHTTEALYSATEEGDQVVVYRS
ncbi:MAG TPA: L,D-transpeptidase [Sporichthyaceae bacterium]|nr:L,D-transpeptidase [Sporichthyaceae bacterium]